MNRIKNVLKKNQMEEMKPSSDFLDSLNVGIKTWNKWVDGRTDPELWQLPHIAELLNCDICELIKEPKHERVNL